MRFKLVLDVIDLGCQRTVTGQVKPRRYRKPQLSVPISLLEGVDWREILRWKTYRRMRTQRAPLIDKDPGMYPVRASAASLDTSPLKLGVAIAS